MRLRANFLTGTLNAQLTNTGVTLSSVELSKMPVVSSPNYMPIALDPFGEFGPPEIAWVTDHASGSSQATLLRHQEGTLARVHNAPTIWANTLTAQDFDDLYAQVDSIEGSLPLYVPLAGGSMSGPLLLEVELLDPLQAVTKAYVDSAVGEGDFVPISGGTMTGKLTLSGAPTALLHAVTKDYCDDKSLATHTHSGYAATSHSHSYEPLGHTHGEYSVTSHGHPWGDISGEPSFSLSSHGHSTYMPISGGNFTGNVTGSQEATFNERIKSNAGIVGETIWATSPLSTTNNGLPGWRHNTTTGSAGWEFMRLVSSIRYKRAIKSIEHDELIEQLQQVAAKLISWEEKGSPAGSPRLYGISAEDAYEIVPQFVALDDEGRPDSVDPANAFTVHLIAAVGDLLARVEVLEGI